MMIVIRIAILMMVLIRREILMVELMGIAVSNTMVISDINEDKDIIDASDVDNDGNGGGIMTT